MSETGLSVAVIGAGSWGTAIANLLAWKGQRVAIWSYEEEVAAAISSEGENKSYLPGFKLHSALVASASLEDVLSGAAVIVFVTPSHAARGVLREALPFLPPEAPIVIASKGIETETLQTMSTVFEEELSAAGERMLASLSGPSFAREVALSLPTAVTVASRDLKTANFIQELFSTDTFRVYTSHDVTGVELGGALKNVIAIAAGISDGLGLGHNSRSALITRGLAEIIRLGSALGADERTFTGLSGLGDLILTCTGDLSRNRTLGMKVGSGEKVKDLLAGMQTVAEGVKTTLATYRLARRVNVEMPIAEQIYRVIYEDADPRQALQELMSRDLRPE